MTCLRLLHTASVIKLGNPRAVHLPSSASVSSMVSRAAKQGHNTLEACRSSQPAPTSPSLQEPLPHPPSKNISCTWRVQVPTHGAGKPSQWRAPSSSMLKRTLRRVGSKEAAASPLDASSAAAAPMNPLLAASQQRATARHARGYRPPARTSNA